MKRVQGARFIGKDSRIRRAMLALGPPGSENGVFEISPKGLFYGLCHLVFPFVYDGPL
ncbi:hypothetical protein J2Z31_005490 [Sinorhizobium kostiense]|uniref:Uncharacterized protein n=1 Tax=Sinorhizobium kostiense TaxID=76747 RepID=A0ABS4R9F3_9HYPH|nr:hypothetical protein [Sinorhizobium kostiense]